MRSLEELRVARAIREALKELNIESHAEFPQLHIRAYHFINVKDWDKTYHLCVPIEKSKRLCYRSHNHYAYTYALKRANEANNHARKGSMRKAKKLFRKAIRYFIERSDQIFIEERIEPYTFRIKLIKSREVNM
jgi:hypothetical protein